MERIPTGIPGFDELIGGGFPAGSTILLSGGAGTGKTIFAQQYIYNGAKDYGQPGIFITLEEGLTNIVWNMQNFSWDIKPLEEQNLMRIYKINLEADDDIEDKIMLELEKIAEMVNEMGAQRLAIDSTTAFSIFIKDQGMLRNVLYRFSNELKKLNCTTLLTAETKGGMTDFSAFGVEEFIVDGVVANYLIPPNRNLFIRKMRGTDHSKTVHPFAITPKGIKVSAKDEVMWSTLRNIK